MLKDFSLPQVAPIHILPQRGKVNGKIEMLYVVIVAKATTTNVKQLLFTDLFLVNNQKDST